MALLNNNLSDILTPQGFYRCVKSLTPELTLEMAYEEVERTHEALTSRRRYNDFDSFNRIKKRFDQKRIA